MKGFPTKILNSIIIGNILTPVTHILIAEKISMNNTRIAENLCECYRNLGS